MAQKAMLKCRRCGIERSHADASIEDNRKTCTPMKRITRENGQVHTVNKARKHNWEEVTN